jgi:hypothetical protein
MGDNNRPGLRDLIVPVKPETKYSEDIAPDNGIDPTIRERIRQIEREYLRLESRYGINSDG